MENLSTPCRYLVDARLDFPSEFVLSMLPYLWDDEKNHQICFVDSSRWSHVASRDELGSMLVSADLVLPTEQKLVAHAVAQGTEAVRTWPVPFLHQTLLDALRQSWQDSLELRETLATPNTTSRSNVATPRPLYYRPQRVITLLLSRIEERNGSIFLIGGSRHLLNKAINNFRATYPEITIVGSMYGTYQPNEEEAIIEAIQKGAPHLILAGEPLPDGELWLPRHMHTTRNGIYLYYAPLMRWLAGKD